MRQIRILPHEERHASLDFSICLTLTFFDNPMKKLILPFLVMVLLVGAAEESAARRDPSFQLNLAARRGLAEKAIALKWGDSYEVILSKLGKPGDDQPAGQNDRGRRFPRTLKYYAVRWDPDIHDDPHDEFVSISLDSGNKFCGVYIRMSLDAGYGIPVGPK